MTYQCAWCKEPLPGYDTNGDERQSDGICFPCAMKVLPAHLHEAFKQRLAAERCKVCEGEATVKKHAVGASTTVPVLACGTCLTVREIPQLTRADALATKKRLDEMIGREG